MKCKRCKQDFGSMDTYAIHTRMAKKIGGKTICPSVEQLNNGDMTIYSGQWFFLSTEMKEQIISREVKNV